MTTISAGRIANYVKLGNEPKSDKPRTKSTGNTRNGFRSDFKSKNENKDNDDNSKLDTGQVTSAASTEWNKVKKTLTEKQIAKYQKITEKIKDNKTKEDDKKEAKAKAKEKEEEKNDSDSDSEYYPW